MRVPDKERDRIKGMLEHGISCKTICRNTGVSIKVIRSIKRELGIYESEMKSEETLQDLYVWLRDHWNWKVENPVKPASRSGYRIVRKGEKGIHTMYRPDGIFR